MMASSFLSFFYYIQLPSLCKQEPLLPAEHDWIPFPNNLTHEVVTKRLADCCCTLSIVPLSPGLLSSSFSLRNDASTRNNKKKRKESRRINRRSSLYGQIELPCAKYFILFFIHTSVTGSETNGIETWCATEENDVEDLRYTSEKHKKKNRFGYRVIYQLYGSSTRTRLNPTWSCCTVLTAACPCICITTWSQLLFGSSSSISSIVVTVWHLSKARVRTLVVVFSWCLSFCKCCHQSAAGTTTTTTRESFVSPIYKQQSREDVRPFL